MNGDPSGGALANGGSLRGTDFFLSAKKKPGKEKAPKGTFVVANLTGNASAQGTRMLAGVRLLLLFTPKHLASG